MSRYRLNLCGMVAAASLVASPGALASGNTVFQLQGTAENLAGFDATHAGPGANFFQGGGETGISTTASDFAAGAHFPDFSAPWVSPDGIIDWAYWDPADGPAKRGPEVLNRVGQRVYRDPATNDFFFHDTDADASGTGHEKLYYASDVQSIGALSFGNFGTQPGASSDWQQAVPTEFDLQQAYDGGFSSKELVSATFTIWIDDVINFALTPDTTVELPSQAFVNVYEGDGDLANFEAVQSKFDRLDQSTAADTVDLVYDDPQLGITPVTRTALARASVFEGVERLRFDFDVTGEVASLLDQGADLAGIILGSTPDGDFTLGSIDAFERDETTGEILENFLPMLTLEFTDPVVLGDMNGDGAVTNGDISAFVLALTDPAGYAASYDLNADAVGDFNDDGQLNNSDIAGFVELLSGGVSADAVPSAVPEPGSLVVVTGLGTLVLLRRRHR